MTEKVRTLNLNSGNVLSTATTPTPTNNTIGAPTLISSTFSGNNQPLTPTTPTPASGAMLGDAETVGLSDTESEAGGGGGIIVMAQLNFHLLPDGSAAAAGGGDVNSIMNSSQISATSNDSMQLTNKPASGKHLAAQSVAGKTCRFPKLEECAHFHYERVELGPLAVSLVDDKSELLNSSIASQSIGGDIASTQPGNPLTGPPSSYRSFSPSNCWFIVKVCPHNGDAFLVKRSFDNMQMLDEMLHRCVYDRKISGLKNLEDLDFKSEEDVEYAVAKYLERFSKIASDSLTCGTILTWLQLDNKGRRLPLADGDTMRTINTPAVGAAYGVRRYQAQAPDEISIEVGDMISVIDMPSPAESIWWRGKKSHLQKSHYEVGFFPQSCVATIGDKVPRHFPMPAPLVGQLDVSPTKPVLRKHGKLISFFRSFILSRPSRRRLKQSGIYRERVFSCDLSEHLMNSGQEIPMVLKCCAEFIEEYGIVDGIYRLSGITSNIQKLRRAFDEERIPDLGNPEMKQDIHAVSSLLKMYFRELPNPLCTYQLYDNFVEAIQEKSESNERLRLMRKTVLKLPPPHYRTLRYLSEHLNKISQHSARTGMTDKNLAIVWAPNLLRSPALESGGVDALRGVGVQAVVTEYLIRNCHNIFDALEESNVRLSYIATTGATPASETRMDSLTDCESLLVEQREHDQSITYVERPKSLGTGGPKLISLEEAQERHSRVEGVDLKTSMPINMVASNAANIGSYIEVGGGPSSLPDKYHTVLSVPRSWQKRKNHSWKSLFMRNQRPMGSGAHELKAGAGTSLSGADISPPTRHKEGVHAQVTFAEADSIITNAGKAGKTLHRQDKPKSIELFETSDRELSNKPMEVCVRSNSIDSLRTAGHSRSVSHDSYFDLLQSPQRGNLTTYPSRELSELGLNFDREEPEMRIFSESESLVSSPRVGKENIPPSSGATSRRIMRARPEEFSSQTNSVNPSPKKQPRLNLHLSPSTATSLGPNWSAGMASASAADAANNHSDVCHEQHAHLSSDESCCKRYKLEDQLSDIQFIDCSTPEHTIANPQTLYASVQVHAPPKSALSKSSLYSSTESANKLAEVYEKKFAKGGKANEGKSNAASASPVGGHISTRYSYPTVQLGAKRKDQEAFKERFSYPGSAVNSEQRFAGPRMHVDEVRGEPEGAANATHNRTPTFGHAVKTSSPHSLKAELLRPKNRSSYCGANDQLNMLLMRSSSSEIPKDAKADMERSKVSVTPSTPPQSPRYSLLVGETSSENSSAVNTPQYDMEPLMITSAMSGLSAMSVASSQQQQQQLLLGVDTSSCMGTSHESLGSNLTTHSNNTNMSGSEKRDIHALKRELSLDLHALHSSSSKMAIDHNDANNASTLPPHSRQQPQQCFIPSPNNSNFTDNTSQSVTPSEFGYQNLQRQSSMHSLIETEADSPAYEEYENTPSNMASPLLGASKLPPPSSPIKSTISITYNLRSPKDESPHKSFSKPRFKGPLLETSFDENTVYEQVKLFRNSVTEVNQLLNEDRKSFGGQPESLKQIAEVNENEKEMHDLSQARNKVVTRRHDPFKQRSPRPRQLEAACAEAIYAQTAKAPEQMNEPPQFENSESDHDIAMQENHADDSLEEYENDNEKLLYENVELRKPKSVYENLMGEEMKFKVEVETETEAETEAEQSDKLDLDSLESVKTSDKLNAHDQDQQQEQAARKSPSNFSVKELATKFETSPVEQLPAFDFSFRNSIKKPSNAVPELKASQHSLTSNGEVPQQAHNKNHMPVPSLKQKQLTKSQQITRSLDENAFVREFGAKQLADLSARSTQQLPEMSEVANRRKSFDFTRPKTLNPPKRLPGMPITEETYSKVEPKLKLELQKEQHYNHNAINNDSTEADQEHDYETGELKITPTTENRISLIQHNVGTAPDLSNSNLNLSSSSLKALSGVKLDRERIDKIKEERRQQLTQKYRGENNFKSRSKTDLHSTKDDGDKFQGESLRVKSKSRGDMRTLQKDIDNIKEFARVGESASCLLAGSESTLNAAGGYTQRVRSISDEKNQNCVNETQPINNDYGKKEEFSARATVQKFERKSMDCANGGNMINNTASVGRGERSNRSNELGNGATVGLSASRHSLASTREKISPQFSIRDMTAMFESRSQNQ